LKRVFDQWDLNRNGHIDERELSDALLQIGELYDTETVREMIKSYDADGSKTITFYGNQSSLTIADILEFSDLFNHVQNLKSQFHSVVQSDRGIGFNEAKNIFSSMHGTSLVAAPVLLYSLWKTYDRTGQGKVNHRDFMMMAFSLKTMLKNYKTGQNPKQHHSSGFFNKFL
jgi:hypothetical protein